MICMLVLGTSAAFAQRMVSGIVTDEKGVPLVAATVAVKGTTVGTITDVDGKYSLDVRDGKVLVISFVGYKMQEIPITGTTINVKLVEEARLFDEVVVTALGIKKNKRALAYSTEQVNTSGLQTVKTINLAEGLQGKVAGLNIISGSAGKGVGADVRIDIRGNRSINGNNQPLIVIDGVPGGSLSGLSPDNIESMNVLKGATAAAL